MFGVVLDACAGAAPERVVWRVVLALRTGAKRNVIAHHPGDRVLRSQNVVQERPLIIIPILGPRLPTKKVPGEFEHVVGVAGFGGVAAQRLRKMLFGTEHFSIAMTADDVRAFFGNGVPEEKRGRS